MTKLEALYEMLSMLEVNEEENEKEIMEVMAQIDDIEDEKIYTSCTARDYSPSSPWNAPGMSVRDFI